MKKRTTKVLALILAVCMICATTASAATTVTIKVMPDCHYQESYATFTAETNFRQALANASSPFAYRWAISFDASFELFPEGEAVTDLCSLPTGTACTTASCGGTCADNYSANSANHHKNLYNFFYQIDDIWHRGTKDILIGVTSVNACSNGGSGHHTGILGLAYAPGRYVVVVNNETRGMMLNVRVIQHELSHSFGCQDNACTSGQNCIMSGGFDNNYNYMMATIWCDNCESVFDVNAV